MSGPRRLLLFLALVSVACVVLLQVRIDDWNLIGAFPSNPKEDSLDTNTNNKGIKVLPRKGVVPSNFSTIVYQSSVITTLNTQNLTRSLPKVTIPSKPLTTPFQNPATAQVRRLPVNVNRNLLKHPDKLVDNRQAKLEEILKHGTVVRERATTNTIRNLRNMPLINPKTVKRILLLTYFRSGSSFFGDLLQQNWKTFYHFEPLHSMTYNSRIGDNKTAEALDLLTDIFTCNFTHANNYMKWVKQQQNRFLFAHNLFLWAMCRGSSKTCFNPSFVNAVCQRAPIHVMKVTRLHMHDLKNYLQQNPQLNIKVVYLTRDPRGVISSRWSLDWCNGTTCSDPDVLCQEMSDDMRVFEGLRETQPQKFIHIRYEDMSLNPEKETQRLFQFLEIPFSQMAQKFLKTHTVGRRLDNKNPYSTRRNSSAMAFSWRERFSYKQVVKVQDVCSNVLRDLNHSLILTPDQLPYPNGRKSPSPTKQLKTLKTEKNLFVTKNINGLSATSSKHLNNTNIEVHKVYHELTNSSLKTASDVQGPLTRDKNKT